MKFARLSVYKDHRPYVGCSGWGRGNAFDTDTGLSGCGAGSLVVHSKGAEVFLLNTTNLHNDNTRSTDAPAPRVVGGRHSASDAPGLGVKPDFASLAPPAAAYGA